MTYLFTTAIIWSVVLTDPSTGSFVAIVIAISLLGYAGGRHRLARLAMQVIRRNNDESSARNRQAR